MLLRISNLLNGLPAGDLADAEAGGGGVDFGVEVELGSIKDLVAGHVVELLDD